MKNYLALAPEPDFAFSYYNLLGYLHGIAITPDRISPNEWIPIIIGEGVPDYKHEMQAREMLQTLLTLLNKYISAFQHDTLTMPFNMHPLNPQHVSSIIEWTAGFEEALSLRPECWEENQGELSDNEQGQLINSLIVVEGVAYPDEAIDMFDHISNSDLQELGITLQEDEIEKVLQIQDFLFQGLEQAVATIQTFGAILDKQRLQKLHNAAIPFPGRSSTVHKNETCPCGSQEINKTCCGAPRIIAGEDKQRIKGNVIKVDFSQKGKTANKTTNHKQDGPSYQLEISLACSEPSIWRRIQVPSTLSLADLHNIIQYCMGWQEMHMHHFQIGLKFYGPQSADDYGETPIHDESRYHLDHFEMDLLRGIVYTYDFGDNWEHVIMLEKVVPANEAKSYPILLEGARACPPEDIGGIGEFQFFLEVLVDPKHEDYDELTNIPGMQGYDPDQFDIAPINQLLQKVYDKK